MKCPKCSYTSFDYYDECKKCGADLTGVRALLQVIAISPDQRAAARPSGPVQPPPLPMGASGQLPGATSGFSGGAFGMGDDFGMGASSAPSDNFETSFDGLVEHTSYAAPAEAEAAKPASAPPPPPKPAAPAKKADEEFLDLDFGNLFEDAEDKK